MSRYMLHETSDTRGMLGHHVVDLQSHVVWGDTGIQHITFAIARVDA